MTVTDTLQTNKTQNAILKKKLEWIYCKSDFYGSFEMLFLPSFAVKMAPFSLNISILIKKGVFIEKKSLLCQLQLHIPMLHRVRMLMCAHLMDLLLILGTAGGKGPGP